MINFFISLLGQYALQGFNLIHTFVQSYICLGLFARKLGRREFYPLRMLLALIEGAAVCYLLAIWYTEVDTMLVRVVCYLCLTALALGVLFFCWRDDLEEMLLTFCSSQAAQWFVAKFYPLLQNLRGIDDKMTISLIHPEGTPVESWEWWLYFGLQFAIYLALSLLFQPKSRLVHNPRTTRNVILLSVCTVLLVNVLICVSRTYEGESWMLNLTTKILFAALCMVILLACAGIFSQSEQEQQVATLQQLWRQDKAQFESIKANMDVINMKCHDLKHILGKIEGKLTEEEAVSLRDAIEFYDSNIRTGNEVLDVVLCEKAMTCQKNGISFSCMADGAKLDFLSPVQIYSLFGNIIDNAVEAVKQLADSADRVISLTCRPDGGKLVIEESNYFAGELSVKDGMPTTSKQDASRHGFGTRSIKYIAEQYGGRMDIRIVDNMFFLTVRFPLKHEK